MSLPGVSTLRRALTLGLAALIVLAVVWATGYAVGRHAAQPAPGREQTLQRAVDSLARVADSVRREADAARLARVLAEQRAAAHARVDIVDATHVRIASPTITPYVVPVAAPVVAALADERAINAALRLELTADSAQLAAETARADSATALAHVVITTRPTWLERLASRVGVGPGYGCTIGARPRCGAVVAVTAHIPLRLGRR